jgi:hypothetical protein
MQKNYFHIFSDVLPAGTSFAGSLKIFARHFVKIKLNFILQALFYNLVRSTPL